MKKDENKNRPKKGSQIKVEPIRKIKHIQTIKKLLADNPRDLCLFTLGINTNLRASDLLQITTGDVRYLKPGVVLPFLVANRSRICKHPYLGLFTTELC